ncbi:MAG TPA: dihydropteroate synthase [Xanthobacteraceae bacterium]|nr:dihydropteroate synthase [Xanthobacteraceae bacterium]
MGIINVTPDSFFPGSQFPAAKAATDAALQQVAQGADILDFGGESTRPGHTPVSEDEELARVIPVIQAITAQTAAPVSIDTYKARVAEAGLKAGAHIVNDVWGLSREPEIANVAAAHNAAVVVMHNRETIDGSLDVIEEFKRFFGIAIERAKRAGIRDDQIVLDPGIGFGKSFEQNLAAIGRLGELVRFGFPVLLGVSRKSFIGKLFPSEPAERLPATIAANAIGVMAGAAIVRVHDVAEHAQALRITDRIKEEQ